MNHDIFISYSSKQKSIADGVCHYLEENGFKCWMAPRDISVGSEYGDLIEEAIKTSKVVVLVFSEAASISKWVKGEVNVAFAEDKPILPFRVDDTEIKGGFRVMLNQMHWIDAFPQYADRLPDLLNSVCSFLGHQPNKVSRYNERLETERKAKETAEKERLEGERKAEEAKRRADQERLERKRAKTQRRIELKNTNRLNLSNKPHPNSKKILWIALGTVVVVAMVLFLVWPREQPPIDSGIEEHPMSVNGSYNGHEYVDLGLPSGLLWATCNVGAAAPEDYGDYFAWGEITPKDYYDWSNYQHCNSGYNTFTKYCDDARYGYNGFTDNLTTLQSGDDAAAANWGLGWYIPKMIQWEELWFNTTQDWTVRNGKHGIIFTARNGRTVFLPAAGFRCGISQDEVDSKCCYWACSLFGADNSADILRIESDLAFSSNGAYRFYGLCVRPVRMR